MLPTLSAEILATVERARVNDADAFERLAELYAPPILKLLHAHLGNFHDAEDSLQRVLLDMHRNLGRLKNARAFNGWILSIVRCRAAATLRSRTRRPETATAGEELAAETAAHENTERNHLVMGAIARLNEPLRTTAELFYVRCHSVKEISALTGSPAGSVKRQLFDSRIKLKRMIRPDFVEESANL